MTDLVESEIEILRSSRKREDLRLNLELGDFI